MTSIIEFLEARIAEDEYEAEVCLAQYRRGEGGSSRRWVRQLAECAAKRAIIKQHKDWPVLVQTPPVFEDARRDLQTMTYSVTQKLAWLTEAEYVTRFGTEPPTAPMVRTLAAIYKDHPDYQQEWAIG